MSLFRTVGCGLLGLLLSAAPAAAADDYPNQPIRVVVGFAAGGPTDVIARVIAQGVSDSLGQPVYVENKTGANSLIATETVARADPDGYTLLFASLSHNVNSILMLKAKYDPIKDFAPVGLAATLPMALVTAPDSPANSVRDLIAMAKAKPDEVFYGSAGNGGSAHLAAAMLQSAAGVKMSHVPFRGNAPALNEVMTGRVTFMFYPNVGVASLVAAKKLKVLAVGTDKRSTDFPTVQTMAEAGYAGFEDTAPWVGMLAPAGTPQPIVERLNAAMRTSLAKPETIKLFKELGAIPAPDTAPEFASFLTQDVERWRRIIKTAGVTAE